MTSADITWHRIKAVFDAVIDLPPAARPTAIAAAGLAPADLAELHSLLGHHDRATCGFLAAAPLPLEGRRFGAWELVRRVGVGGMGEVFEARRADGSFEGRAAVKVLPAGRGGTVLAARFAQERQWLARLNHPHIARLMDGGVTPEGQPYFVMEFVDGQPLDQAARALPVEGRLALMLQLCDAVAFAHRQLLVHRDLKPGNVLVDAQGQVKLLDFGIAKLIDPAAADPNVTQALTPNYASPEQVRGEPVGTGTDIYSLGVLLYQLLTGVRPTGRQATTAQEAARSVLEDEPTRPSRLSPADVDDPHWPAAARALQGDLDNIVLKALEKAPERRYASVDALRADIEAFLSGHPVSARPAKFGYLLSKWLGRHRAAAGAAVLGGLGLLTGLLATLLNGRVALGLGATGLAAGLVLALVQARRAQLARDAAAQARDAATRHLGELRQLANSMVFDVSDALEQGLIEGRRQLVRAAEQSLERQAAFGPMSDAERITLGWALARLAKLEGHENTNNAGNLRGALSHYGRALQVLEPLAARQQGKLDWHAAMAATLEGQFAGLRATRQPEPAMAALERAAAHAARATELAPDDLRLRCHQVSLLILLADHAYPIVRFHGLGQLPLAQSNAQAAGACSLALLAAAPAESRVLRSRAQVMRLQAGLLAIEGRLADALALDDDGLAVLEGGFHLPGGAALRASDLAQARIRRAITQRAAGRYDDAHATLLPALAQSESDLQGNVGDEHRQRQFVAVAQTMLDLHLHRGDEAGAQTLYERAHHLLPRLGPQQEFDPLSRRPWQHAWMDSLQAVCWARTGQAAQARVLVERLGLWMAQGTLRLRTDPSALDAELEANIGIARAQLAVVQADEAAAAAAVEATLERLAAMQALRDPSDAIEAIRRWQLTVRLAQSLSPPLQARVVALARVQQAALVARGCVEPATRRESRWLADQAET